MLIRSLTLCWKPVRYGHNSLGGTDMFAGATTGTFLRNNGIDSGFQNKGPAFFRTPFKATAAEEGLVPGITNLPVQAGLPQLDLLKIHFLESLGRADTAAFHTQHAGGPPGKDLRSAGPAKEKINPGSQNDAVKATDLGTLAAMQAAGQKILFRPRPGRPQESNERYRGAHLQLLHRWYKSSTHLQFF